MYNEISKFIIYRDMKGERILTRLGKIFEDFDNKSDTKEHLISRIYLEIRNILEIATKYGFDNKGWKNEI